MLQLVDSNVHPTLSGQWLNSGGRSCSFEECAAGLREAGFSRACAVGLPGVGDYDVAAFAEKALKDPLWLPIAAWARPVSDVTAEKLEWLKDLGYRAVKLHPRLLGEPLQSDTLGAFLGSAAVARLPVCICCYPFRPAGTGFQGDLLTVIAEALENEPGVNLMLMHAGCSELMRYVDFARVNPGVLLDLSFTLCKYKHSSIDIDIEFLFKNFDRRICIGSDFPEFSFSELRGRFEMFSKGIDSVRAANIGRLNILRFLGEESQAKGETL